MNNLELYLNVGKIFMLFGCNIVLRVVVVIKLDCLIEFFRSRVKYVSKLFYMDW